MNPRPNILFMCADHHIWHGIAGRSLARTPNLNRLAEQGLLFERSYTPISVCCPARAMLASGAYPWHNGVYNQVHVPQLLSRDLLPDVVTYSQRLRDAGYQLGYNGKWHASHTRGPMDFGFYQNGDPLGVNDAYLARHGIAPAERFSRQSKPHYAGEQRVSWPGSEPFLMWACDESEPESTHTHFLAERAARMIAEFSQGDKPRHVEVHFPEPHDAYTPLRRFLDNYSLDDIELPRSYYDETFENKPRLLQREASLWAEVKALIHRPLIGTPKTCTIRRQAGKWFACFTCEYTPEPLPPSSESVGIDVGSEKFAALSDGTFVDNPRFFRRDEKALAKAGRKQAKQKRGSTARRKANKVLSRIHERIRNRRHDFVHQLARRLVNQYGLIAVEKLNVKSMLCGKSSGMVQNRCLAK